MHVQPHIFSLIRVIIVVWGMKCFHKENVFVKRLRKHNFTGKRFQRAFDSFCNTEVFVQERFQVLQYIDTSLLLV